MWLEFDAYGIDIKFRINGYEPSTRDEWDSQWCRCDFLFFSSDWLNYHREDYEVLLSCEVEELERSLTELLNNRLHEVKEISCIEPDFVFKLYPKTDIRNDPSYTYVQPGCEIEDIYIEWKIYFWNQGLTDNHLVITLGRNKIKMIRNYLNEVMKSKSHT